ncbi:hypothetical protein COLO4_08066 [Corchorus olitorius]|uniref:Uncharacterized protein n=1 Tax=Corchorus olitorius TaxID=93759 RepID=A0A1R3KHJ9_9ROSI|nr:hypothetical protein COLO4_08066 [Corchorus olitorius]
MVSAMTINEGSLLGFDPSGDTQLRFILYFTAYFAEPRYKAPLIEELEKHMHKLNQECASAVLEIRYANNDDEMMKVEAAVKAAMLVFKESRINAAEIKYAAKRVEAAYARWQANLPVKLHEFGYSNFQDLKEENLRLKEIQGKAAWSFRGAQDEPNKSKKVGENDQVIPYGTIASLISNSSKGSGIFFQELMMNRQVWEDKSKTNGGYNIDFIKPAPAPTGSVKPFNTTIVPNIDGNGVVEERREIALSDSI